MSPPSTASWRYELLARYRAEGEAAFEPRSRRPKASPSAIPAATVELIIRLREELSEAGLDARPDTICWHLTQHHDVRLSPATVAWFAKEAGRRGSTGLGQTVHLAANAFFT